MSTKYIIKKCNTFGFAVDLNEAVKSFAPIINEEYSSKYVLHLTGPDADINRTLLQDIHPNVHTITKLYELKRFIESEEFIKLNNSNTVFKLYVDLGYITKSTAEVPLEYDDSDIIKEFKPSFELSADTLEEYSEYIIRLRDEPNIFGEGSLTNDYINYIIELYPNLRDCVLKNNIASVLLQNSINPKELEEKYPIEYETVETDTAVNAPIFSDIEVVFNKDEKNVSSKMYRMDPDALKKAISGGSVQFDAFTSNKFAIIRNRKDANIENRNIGQNHDVLDTLAVNGVLFTPTTTKPLSIFSLMKLLSKMRKFDICFIHPYSEIKSIRVEFPCEQAIPAYKLNGGEILAVAYRYLIVQFFGYCSIFSDSMLEWRYYI